MFISTKHRNTQTEIMDDLALDGEMLRKTLDQLSLINKWLGGIRPTIGAVRKLINPLPKERQITIVDIGCGGGDVLRELADFGKKRSRNFNLVGIDANKFIINYAKEKTAKYPEISYFSHNVFSVEFSQLNYDIALFNLVLHHFSDEEIIRLLSLVSSKAKVGVIINDLQRSSVAYHLFQLLSLAIANPMAREDGLISILRGFRKKDLMRFSKKLKLKKFVIQKKWAFRYLWTIYNLNP